MLFIERWNHCQGLVKLLLPNSRISAGYQFSIKGRGVKEVLNGARILQAFVI
jgi:hypothetical protein